MVELFDLIGYTDMFYMELSYCKTSDWMLKIYCKSPYCDNQAVIFNEQSCDYKYLISKAEVAVKNYMNNNFGGY